MTVIQIGKDKCGNYWLWNIIHNSLEVAGIKPASYIQNSEIYPLAKNWELSFPEQAKIDMVSWAIERKNLNFHWSVLPMWKRRIDDLPDYVKQSRHLWTHSSSVPGLEEIFQLINKRVLITRDPRDVLLSTEQFYKTDYHKREFNIYKGGSRQISLPNTTIRWARYYAEWLLFIAESKYSFHCITYERLLMDFDEEYRRLLNYLELDLNEKQIAEVANRVTFDTMKKSGASHVNKGEVGRWRDEYESELIERMSHRFEDLFKLLNYSRTVAELDGQLASEAELPDLTVQLSSADKEMLRDLLHRMPTQVRGWIEK